MHARIILLAGNPNGKALSAYGEQVLIEVSAAFRHSFSLVHEKIGDESQKLYGERLTQETVEIIKGGDGALLFSGETQDEKEILDALGLPVRIRSYCVPLSLCGRQEQPISLWIAVALSSDAETICEAASTAFHFAKAVDAGVLTVPPNGALKPLWENTIRDCRAKEPALPVSIISPQDAVQRLILCPHQMGVVLCPPYVGGILTAAADALCAWPPVLHDASINGECAVYSVSPLRKENSENSAIRILSPLYTVIDLLRFSLRLEQEAACVEAALNNVLMEKDSAMDEDRMIGLICEQISVAGELMHKGGI